ncbi:MAG: hypothetical protein AAGH83_00685 [Pseudomonadota bacterium]
MRRTGLIATLAMALVLAWAPQGHAAGDSFLDVGFRPGSDLLDSESQVATTAYFDRLAIVSEVLGQPSGLTLLVEQDSVLRHSSDALISARLHALGSLSDEIDGLDVRARFREGLGANTVRLTIDTERSPARNCPWQAAISIPETAGGGSISIALSPGGTLYLPPGVHLTFQPNVDADLDASIWWRRGDPDTFRSVFVARPIADPGEVVLRLASPEPRARSLAPPASTRGSSDSVRPPSLPTVAECRVDIVATE